MRKNHLENDILSQEKKEWLKKLHVIDIKKFDYLVPETGHLFSIKYFENTPLEEIKSKYDQINKSSIGEARMMDREETIKIIQEQNDIWRIQWKC